MPGAYEMGVGAEGTPGVSSKKMLVQGCNGGGSSGRRCGRGRGPAKAEEAEGGKPVHEGA